MSPKVTVVVPVYNVEKYLEKCVASLTAQTLEDIEIILVDDGSSDNSPAMCDELAKTDNRIKVIHKANGGLSDARNFGIDVASAEYVGFVDSDDYVDEKMFETLYECITTENADMAAVGFMGVYENEMRPAYKKTSGRFTAETEETIKLILDGENASVSAANKLYKKSLLLKNKFLKGKTSEDAHFIIPYVCLTKKAVFDMAPMYYYVHHEGTITTSGYKPSDLSIIEAYENNYKIVEKKFPKLIKDAQFRVYWSYFYILDKMLNTKNFKDKAKKKEIIAFLRKNYKGIKANPLVGGGRKLAMSGLMVSELFYKAFLYAYSKKYRKISK